jgi:uncharacterized cupin superfamily protein
MNKPALPTRPVVNLADLELDRWAKGERYASADVSFGGRLGLGKLGISYSEVPPGKSGCPFHNHSGEDEAFLILEGEGTYRYGDARHAVRAGDVLGAPAGGRETAHQLVNTGTAPLRYVGVSANVDAEIVEYPDSGKFLAVSRGAGRDSFRFVGRQEDEVDYWDGEPGA